MPASSDQLKAALPASVGDTGTVAANLDTIWAMFDEKAAIDPLLQFYYAQREALGWLIREYAKKPSRKIADTTVNYGDIARDMQLTVAELDSKIATLETGEGAGVAASQIARTAPIQAGDTYNATFGFTDANDPRITGNPYLGPTYPYR